MSAQHGRCAAVRPVRRPGSTGNNVMRSGVVGAGAIAGLFGARFAVVEDVAPFRRHDRRCRPPVGPTAREAAS